MRSRFKIEGDKGFTLWITFYDKRLFEGDILPYRGRSTKHIQVTSSDVNVDRTNETPITFLNILKAGEAIGRERRPLSEI